VSGMPRLVPIGAVVALGLGFCHPVDPPVPPPRPTDPTSLAQGAATVAQGAPTEVVIDASIVNDGGAGWDGAWFEVDAGASRRRAASP